MRKTINELRTRDPRLNYRGDSPSRFDNLTDAVFGIAITLLIFNVSNPNSFADLLTFTKTLPAFLISISFIMLIWNEHLRFAEIFTLNDTVLSVLNTVFIGLVIFYVYPLRFLTLFLTNFFFQTDVRIGISGDQVPYLMIYYGAIAFGLYFVLFLFYWRTSKLSEEFGINKFEKFYVKAHQIRLGIMFSVPLFSIGLTLFLVETSFIWASVVGGVFYIVYTPLMLMWYSWFQKRSKAFGHV